MCFNRKRNKAITVPSEYELETCVEVRNASIGYAGYVFPKGIQVDKYGQMYMSKFFTIYSIKTHGKKTCRDYVYVECHKDGLYIDLTTSPYKYKREGDNMAYELFDPIVGFCKEPDSFCGS